MAHPCNKLDLTSTSEFLQASHQAIPYIVALTSIIDLLSSSANTHDIDRAPYR